MSGVVDSKGQQWERCHKCGIFVRFPENLGYMRGSFAHRCIECANKEEDIYQVIPAPEWAPIYEEPLHA